MWVWFRVVHVLLLEKTALLGVDGKFAFVRSAQVTRLVSRADGYHSICFGHHVYIAPMSHVVITAVDDSGNAIARALPQASIKVPPGL